jgi:hypothetical protein
MNKYKNNKEKLMTNINEKKNNKYFSNYYNYFIKSKNICNAFSRNNAFHKYNSSLNPENKSKSVSQSKITKNLTQKTIYTTRYKKEKRKDKSMINLNSLNIQKNSSKVNLNIFKKESLHYKEKKQSLIKNKVKAQYNITYNDNKLAKNKLINKRNSTSKRKSSINKKELFIDLGKSNKGNSYGKQKMIATSLLNIHKLKDSQDKKKKFPNSGELKNNINKKNNSKNKEFMNKLVFRNDLDIEDNKNIKDKPYCDIRNLYSIPKNNRNNTDINCIQKNN